MCEEATRGSGVVALALETRDRDRGKNYIIASPYNNHIIGYDVNSCVNRPDTCTKSVLECFSLSEVKILFKEKGLIMLSSIINWQ